MFRHHFGIEFTYEGHTYVRTISPFKFARCYNLEDEITYKISHQSNIFCLDAAIPGRTSAHIFDQLLTRLVSIRDANCSIFSPNQYAAPAACAQAFLNGAVGIRLPDKAQWVEAYLREPVMKCIIGFVEPAPSATKLWRRWALTTITVPPFASRASSSKTDS